MGFTIGLGNRADRPTGVAIGKNIVWNIFGNDTACANDSLTADMNAV